MHTPIGDKVVPGGLEPGEQLGAVDLVIARANDLADCDSEDDAAYERARKAVVNAGLKVAAELGWVKPFEMKRTRQELKALERERDDLAARLEAQLHPPQPEAIGWTEEMAAKARDIFGEHLVKNLRCVWCKRPAVKVAFKVRWSVEPADREHRLVSMQPEELQSFCKHCNPNLPSVHFKTVRKPPTAGPKGLRPHRSRDGAVAAEVGAGEPLAHGVGDLVDRGHRAA